MRRFNSILLGLPIPRGIPVATHWSLSSNLRKGGYQVIDCREFSTLQVELLRIDSPYLSVIHSGILNLTETTNAHQAFLISLAHRFNASTFRIWDPKNLWPQSEGIPPNLALWTNPESSDIEEMIITLSEVHH